ncbi:hypothetical protein Q0F98_14055 [Paenibacillus amylolyticus]|nr:hypothetical protein Q0F98_14055 [Paenibacillus amylolyticus]
MRCLLLRCYSACSDFYRGLASTGLTVVVRSIIGDGGNVDNRGLYNGYISSSEGGGMVLGPVISGWLALHWPLSVPFYSLPYVV